MNRTAKWIAAGAGIVSATYATYVATAWARYGRRKPAKGAARDALLDAFMPRYDVCERHAIDLATPAEVTLAAAKNLDLDRSLLVRALFKGRELLLRSRPDARARPEGLLELTRLLGWGVLADTPGEIVMGAVTRPWEANPVFRAVPPAEFAAFAEPGQVKYRLDVAGGCGRGRQLDVPHRDSRGGDRRGVTQEVSLVLVVPLARHHPSSAWRCGMPFERRRTVPGA